MKLNIGLDKKGCEKIADDLSVLLADTYTLYLKTQNFHWNVKGPMFFILHKMFEEQYEELASGIDKIAERIRSLGVRAPGTFAEFLKLANLKESKDVKDYKEMVQILLDDHEQLIRDARKKFVDIDNYQDEVTADLVTERLEAHEKTAWMIRSILE